MFYIGIKYKATYGFVTFWPVVPFGEGKNFIRFSIRHVTVLNLQISNIKLYTFQNRSLGFILKVFLKFRKI